MPRQCEYPGCTDKMVCFHYCRTHHEQVCIDGLYAVELPPSRYDVIPVNGLYCIRNIASGELVREFPQAGYTNAIRICAEMNDE